MHRLFSALIGFVLSGGAACQDAAAETPVDLELVLSVDVSMSVDPSEQRLQRDGYIAAFRDGAVIEAIQGGLLGRIAVTYVEWAGMGTQQVLVPWTLIDSPASARAFADRLASAPLDRRRRTSISEALLYSLGLFDDNGFEGTQRKIDVSGDGPNNAGGPVELARDFVVERGVTINGLTIMLQPDQPAGFFDIRNLDIYFEDCVIGGIGAFNLVVRHEQEFAAAIRAKLLLEIAGIPSPLHPTRMYPARFDPTRQRMDCLIGEKLWERFMEYN